MKCNLSDRRIDGFYGWFVVCFGFSMLVITDGITFTFGNLLVELVEYFDADRATISLIGSLMTGIACIVGPISGGLCDRFGCRMVAVTGAVISFIGLLISSFATSVTYLYFTYGILGGTGLGFMYLSANVVAVQYFDKYRGLACGITLCGSGVGVFTFSLLTRGLIDEYGWRGTVLLEAGICFQGSVFGLLLLPPDKGKVADTKPTQDEQKVDKSETETETKADTKPTQDEQKVDKSETETETKADTKPTQDEQKVDKSETEIETKADTKPTQDEQKVDKSETETETKAKKGGRGQRLKLLLRSLRNLFDFTLLTNAKFLIFILSVFAVHLAFPVVIHMTVDRSLELGMTKYEASWLNSAIGIASIIGRGILGGIGDRQIVNRVVMVYVLLLLTGLSTMLSCLLKKFSTLVTYSAIYGFLSGGYIALCPSVLAELFSAELIARSFGLYLLFLGISSTAATPIGGYLFDISGSYDVTFIAAGSEFLTAGVLVIVLQCLHVHYRKN